MRVGRYQFAPPWWGVLAFMLVSGAMCALGMWQIDRGVSKRQMLAQQEAAIKSAPEPFSSSSAEVPDYGHRYTVTGRMDAEHQILFDNQVFDEKVGYGVWTPMVLADGRRVLIDRGWVPLGRGGRSDVPEPSSPTGELTMTGLWRDLPEPGMRLSDDLACEGAGWPRVLNYPTIESIQCHFDGPVVDGLLLLDEDDARGFARNWQAGLTRMPPVRHYGYALQWFAMAVAVLAIFLIVNFKRTR